MSETGESADLPAAIGAGAVEAPAPALERNAKAIVCPRQECVCKVLTPNAAVLAAAHKFDLPTVRFAPKAAADSVSVETCEGFWVVKDKFDFFNIGFSNPVGSVAFLTCADCDYGPIGYHDATQPDAFYVACARVADKP